MRNSLCLFHRRSDRSLLAFQAQSPLCKSSCALNCKWAFRRVWSSFRLHHPARWLYFLAAWKREMNCSSDFRSYCSDSSKTVSESLFDWSCWLTMICVLLLLFMLLILLALINQRNNASDISEPLCLFFTAIEFKTLLLTKDFSIFFSSLNINKFVFFFKLKKIITFFFLPLTTDIKNL